jgi:hypothetical protein
MRTGDENWGHTSFISISVYLDSHFCFISYFSRRSGATPFSSCQWFKLFVNNYKNSMKLWGMYASLRKGVRKKNMPNLSKSSALQQKESQCEALPVLLWDSLRQCWEMESQNPERENNSFVWIRHLINQTLDICIKDLSTNNWKSGSSPWTCELQKMDRS